MKDIKEGTNKLKDILCSWIGRPNIVKMITLHKATYRFTTILIQISMKIFTNMEQRILKFVWNHKKKVKSQRNLETEWQKGRASWFQTILQSCINQTVWYCYKNGHKNHWNRIEIPVIKPIVCGQSIYDKKVEIIASGKDCLFKNGVVKAGWLHAKEWNWKTLTPFTKINSKWIKDLIISPEAIKILEEGLPLWL